MNNDKITLKNMAFYAYHGTHPGEVELGQRFFIDVEMYTDLSKAGEKDDLTKTIDYKLVFNCVKEVVEKRRFELIEALGETIAKEILKKFPAEKVCIRVRKPSSPLQGIIDYVEIEIWREKNNKPKEK